MTRTSRLEAFAIVAAIALALCLLALVVVRPAGAAFTDANGKIAFQRGINIWVKGSTLAAPETELLKDTTADSQAAFSPDGSRVAFMRLNEIYVANANGTGTPRRLTSDCFNDSNPAWSHDGTRIVFVRRSGHPDNPCAGGYNIWTMNADGTNQRQLTSEGGFSSPSWSVPVLPGAPDGKILYKGGGLEIWTMNPDGTVKVKLTYTCPTENGICDNAVGNPTFSPDGTEIAAEYFGDIFVIPSGGGESRVILGTPKDGYPGQELDPTWSPDGTMIAFEFNDPKPPELPRTEPDPSPHFGISWARADGSSSAPTQITNNGGELDPHWQPIPVCTKTVNAANDPLAGTAGKDVLCGDARANTINGAGGNDIVLAQGGNDRLTGALGNDTLNGGPGTDTVLYSGTTAVTANLTTEFATGVGLDVLLGVENLSGSSASDRLTGSAVANALVGGAGSDILSGLGGPDTLNSRDGVNGNDTLNGGVGTDRCVTDARERSIMSCP